MKKVATSCLYELRPVAVFRGDLGDITSILNGVNAEDITVSHGNYEFDSLDELERERGTQLKFLTIQGWVKTEPLRRGLVSVDFLPSYTRLYGSDPGCVAAIASVRDLLAPKQRRWSGKWTSIFSGSLFWVAITLAAFTATAVKEAFTHQTEPAQSRFIAISIVSAILTGLAFLGGFGLPLKARISLKKQHEHQTFWQKYQDEFVKTGIGLGSGLVGYLIRVLQKG